jgi:hypothetical protein
MKKIIRLTESDLTRIVRRVIKEQQSGGYTQNAKTAIKLIEDGIAYVGGTDETMIAKGLYAIKTKEDYQHVLKHANAKGFKSIMGWVSTDWNYIPSSSDFGVSSSDNELLLDVVRHLQQFNPSETYKKTSAMGSSPGRTSNDGTFKPRN